MSDEQQQQQGREQVDEPHVEGHAPAQKVGNMRINQAPHPHLNTGESSLKPSPPPTNLQKNVVAGGVDNIVEIPWKNLPGRDADKPPNKYNAQPRPGKDPRDSHQPNLVKDMHHIGQPRQGF